jgi:predicted nuclease with TOPRIM domain
MELTKELYETVVAIVDDRMSAVKVIREEFGALQGVVKELAQAQKRTEERVEELAQAQKRTEERVEELAQAQKRTEERVEELAQAQKRTEERVEELSSAIKDLAHQVGVLSETIGFGLEDIARVVLPGYLERHYGIQVSELSRRFLLVDGQEVELNLYGEGQRDGSPVIVIGECKSRIYEREVKIFAKTLVEVTKVLPGEIFKLIFGYLIHPSADREAKQHGIELVASYQR